MVKQLLRPSVRTAIFAVCLFGVIVGLKWATFDRFGSAMPDWDQWDAEAKHLLTPWLEHDHFFEHFFQAHNEHRVVLTKVQNLSLTLLNGQWDARLEGATNALVHTALAVALWLLARRRLPTFTHAPLWLLTVVLFGPPLAWQNVLGGFHSQQYWLLAFSFVSIVLLPFARPWTRSWWLATAAASLALLTMGSGLLAAAVVIVVVGFRALRRETSLREAWPTLAVCAVLVAVGALTRVEVYYHEHMKVKTAHDFFFSLLHSMQWPVPSGHDWLAVVLWAPWFLAAWRVLRDREPVNSRTGQIFVALGGWVLVQLLATAYARGAGADFPASRYMDTLTFGAMVNALCLAWLLSCLPRLTARLACCTLSLAWLLTLGFGLRALLHDNLDTDLPHAKAYYVKAEAHLRGYLATNDPAQLEFPDVPYPSAGGLIERLRPGVRALMPAVVRPPLEVKPAAYGPFLENYASQLTLTTTPSTGLSPLAPPLASLHTWGSFDPTIGVAATGEWRSAPLTSPLGAYLKFETAGPLGESAETIALELRDATSDALLATVSPSKIPGDTWRAAYVSAPSKPFVIVARDRDSARWLAFSAPVEMGRLSYLAWRATQNGLLLSQLASLGALGLSLLILADRRRSRQPSTTRAPAHVKPARATVSSTRPTATAAVSFSPVRAPTRRALALALFLAIWGAKLIAIDHYGSDLPYWDQWGKEGDFLLVPWFEHHDVWSYLFVPHNEHRIAPTLALNLALVVDGGQWDARVQCVASAALHAAVAAGLFLWALRRFTLPWALSAGAVLLLTAAPPIAWENVLGGFQSQFYFLMGFTLLAFGGLLGAPAFSLRWWGGVLCGFLALVSMGSGLLLAAPLAALALLRLYSQDQSRRDAAAVLGVAVVLGVLGACLRASAPHHEPIHAHSVTQFLGYALRCLAWPLPEHSWLAPLLWSPWLVLLFRRIKTFRAESAPATVTADFLLAAGAWVLLQVAAVSFSRAGGGDMPASRYGDVSALGLIISFFSLAHLAAQTATKRRYLFLSLGLAFITVAALCISTATRASLAGPLPAKKSESLIFERNVQAFVLTDDYETFAKSRLPFPLPDWLARLLRRPDIRAVLPASVRAPIQLPDFSTTAAPPARPLFERRTHSLVTAGEWRSAPLPAATLGWWKIETAGPAFSASSPTQPPLTLAVGSGTPRPIAASQPPGPEAWRAGYVPAPHGPATLQAHATGTDHWLAFTEPVEVSTLSYRTWQFAKQGEWVMVFGLAGFILLAATALRRSLRPVGGKGP